MTPARLAELLAEPTLSENVDEDRAIVWPPLDLTDIQRGRFAALLTLDLDDACEGNRMVWDAIADADRARGGR